jgi:hypothetical protein
VRERGITSSTSSPLIDFPRVHTNHRQPHARAGQPTWLTHPHLLKPGELTPGIQASEYRYTVHLIRGLSLTLPPYPLAAAIDVLIDLSLRHLCPA